MKKWNFKKEPIPIIYEYKKNNVDIELTKSSGNVEEYPAIQSVLTCDSQKLLEEFLVIKEFLEKTDYLSPSSSKNKELSELYFLTLEKAGPYTLEILNCFENVKYPRYSIVHPGWNLGAHIDYKNASFAGFKMHIPLQTNSSAINFMLIDDKWKEFQLKENNIWFMNVGMAHKACNRSRKKENKRIFLTFDLWSDKNIPLENQVKKVNYIDDSRRLNV